jgi:hypothetical protein
MVRGTVCTGEEPLSMSVEELKEFFAAMEFVRQVNAAFSDVACDFLDQDDDLDDDCGFAVPLRPVTIH